MQGAVPISRQDAQLWLFDPSLSAGPFFAPQPSNAFDLAKVGRCSPPADGTPLGGMMDFVEGRGTHLSREMQATRDSDQR
jgi:hypothetical protein